ncbi:MAG: hypothetical protein ACT4O4_02860 [Nitrospiraceae bacterium]
MQESVHLSFFSVPAPRSPEHPAQSMPTAERSCGLIITDVGPSDWSRAVEAVVSPPSTLEVMPLGISQDQYLARYGAELDRGRPWTFSKHAGGIAKARERIREHVPKLMVQLQRTRLGGTKTLLELLQGDGFNAWWFLEISEKSAYRGELINRLYQLALVQAVFDFHTYEKVWICLKDEVLARTIEKGLRESSIETVLVGTERDRTTRGAVQWLLVHFTNALGVGALHFLQLVLIRGLNITRARLPSPRSLLLFTFYPRMWSAPYRREASEWFFGSLPEHFPDRVSSSYVVWLTAWPWEIWRNRKELRTFFRTRKALWLAPFAGTRALMSVVAPRWWMLHVRLSDAWQRSASLLFGLFDLGDAVRDELHRSLSSPELFRDLLLVDACKRLTASVPASTVLYRLEFQPFESAILFGTRGQASTLAFQHSTFGKNYLPYHFNRAEVAPSGVSGAMPLPDVILASGEYGRAAMLRNGCPSQSIEVCGPLRYRSFFGRVRERQTGGVVAKRTPDASAAKSLVVATAVSRPDAEGLIEALGACLHLLENTTVLFRSHPALPLETRFEELVGRRLGAGRYKFLASAEELYDALADADGAVMNYSTVMMEAVELGVVPVIFESGAVFDPKALEQDEWAGIIATNAEELARGIEHSLRSDESLRQRHGLVEQGRQWFDQPDIDPYGRVIETLSRRGIIPRSDRELVGSSP